MGLPRLDVTVYLVPAGEQLDLDNGEVRESQRASLIHRKTALTAGFHCLRSAATTSSWPWPTPAFRSLGGVSFRGMILCVWSRGPG